MKASPWRSRARLALWLALPLMAIGELVAHYAILESVVPETAWQRVGERVREEWKDGDAFSVSPGWADPLARAALGDVLTASVVGRSGIEGYERIWVLTAHGAPLVPPCESCGTEELDETIDGIRIRRFETKARPVLFDFTQALEHATVSRIEKDGDEHICRIEEGRPEGGGLGDGPVKPARRFVCDGKRKWLWVARTTIEDLDYQPRHCVWHRAQGRAPVRIAYADVPLGATLRFEAGLYLRHERKRKGDPIELRVFVDDEESGRFVHRDGDGWDRYEVAIPPAMQGKRAAVRIEVTTDDAKDRGLCWDGKSL